MLLGIYDSDSDDAACVACCEGFVVIGDLQAYIDDHEEVIPISDTLRESAGELSDRLFTFGLWCDHCGKEIFPPVGEE